MNNGGDVLARGGRSAQFSAGGSTVNDPIELRNVAPETTEDITSGITVIDKRSRFDSEPVKKSEPKYPAKTYGTFQPILDKVLIMRVSDDPDEVLLEDGSTRNRKTGFITVAKYRQHSRVGVVLAVGDFVTIGGVKTHLRDILKPGYRVMFGEYNAEKLIMRPEQVKELCDAIQVEYEASEELDVVRIHDIRGIYKPVEDQNYV